MKTRICLLALSAVLATACATPALTPSRLAGTKGQVTVAGIEPARVLGAIDTAKVVKHPDVKNAGDPAETLDGAPRDGATGIAVEGAEPAAVLAAIDTTKLVGPATKTQAKPAPSANASDLPPQVAKAAAKKNYTTKDLAEAQREAVKSGG